MSGYSQPDSPTCSSIFNSLKSSNDKTDEEQEQQQQQSTKFRSNKKHDQNLPQRTIWNQVTNLPLQKNNNAKVISNNNTKWEDITSVSPWECIPPPGINTKWQENNVNYNEQQNVNSSSDLNTNYPNTKLKQNTQTLNQDCIGLQNTNPDWNYNNEWWKNGINYSGSEYDPQHQQYNRNLTTTTPLLPVNIQRGILECKNKNIVPSQPLLKPTPPPPRPRWKSITEEQVFKLTGLSGVELTAISLSQLLTLVDKRGLNMAEYDCLKYKRRTLMNQKYQTKSRTTIAEQLHWIKKRQDNQDQRQIEHETRLNRQEKRQNEYEIKKIQVQAIHTTNTDQNVKRE